jgi:HK97 family phage prohead protease|tara:strand:+ start:8300 stop:9682 length:1383 start_codon:yes stop_codon:yes gene_type:complete
MMATALRTSPFSQTGSISVLKSSGDLVVAGYASVEMVDKQGDLITRDALKNAFDGFMKSQEFRNVQLAHSNIQVGSVIDAYTDSSGRVWKSGVDDAGLFVVIKVRDDIEKAREVANEIRKGSLRGFSIGGQAFKRVNKSDSQHGDYTEISKLELHEVTICEKGINPEATFRILKEDTTMTNENEAMSELSSVLDRINLRLDAMEKGEGEMPQGLKEHMKDKRDDDKPEDKKTEDKGEEMADDEDKKEGMYAKSEYSDVITEDYLHWMENTLKSAGVDTDGARAHFDQLSKANLGSDLGATDGAEYFAGQVKGRAQENGSPSTNAIGKLNSGSGGSVAKGFLSPSDLTPAQVEEAYAAYKAASVEKQLKSSLGAVFADRLAKEQTAEVESRRASEFDARGPLASIEKAVAALSERIDGLATGEGTTLRKSEAAPSITVPSTEDMANMSWDEVHALAGRAFN